MYVDVMFLDETTLIAVLQLPKYDCRRPGCTAREIASPSTTEFMNNTVYVTWQDVTRL